MADSDYDEDYDGSDFEEDDYEESDNEEDYYSESDDNYYGGSNVEDDYYEDYDDGDEYYEGSDEEYYGGSDAEDDYCEDYDNTDDFYEDSDIENHFYEESDVDYDSYENDEYGGNSVSYSPTTPKQRQQSSTYEWTIKNSIVDKQSGSYARTSVKESNSSGDVFKERSTGRIGNKDEFRWTSTWRVGDKGGYSEYQREETYRWVDYSNSSSSNRMGKNKYLK